MLQFFARALGRVSLTQSLSPVLIVVSAIGLVGCGGGGGGGGGGGTQPSTTVTVGGSVTGLAGSGLVLRNNGSGDLPILANGAFTFTNPIQSGSIYNVSVASQPTNPSQNCIVTRGTDGATGGNVTNVSVTCTTNSFTISGTVSGLAGTGLVLQNNGGGNITVTANGAFTFATSILSGDTYSVTAPIQPVGPNQTCAVTSGGGTVTTANITNVAVVCVTNNYQLGVTVTGLAGSGLVLQNNGGSDLNILANGSYNFLIPVPSGSTYAVTALTQPVNVSQTCGIVNGTGTIVNANVNKTVVTCVTNRFTIGGTVSGLTGTGLKLRNNGGDEISIGGNGAFAFPTSIMSGAAFSVTASSQPNGPSQSCTPTNATGTVGEGNVTSVSIVCATATFTVGGTVTGLTGTGLVLRNNDGDNLAVSGNTFTFATRVPSGGAYSVSTFTNPTTPSQTCTPSAASGTIVNSNVSNVVITCVTNKYLVNVAVSGLAGSAVVLQNNGGDDLTIASDGSSSFATTLDSGSTYDIRVLTNPALPNQLCRVTNGYGTVTNSAVTLPTVACRTTMTRFAVTLDTTSQTGSHYAVDYTTGQLRSRGFVNTGPRPISNARDSTEKWGFVLNRGSATVSVYARDPVTGDSTEVAGSPFATGAVANNTAAGGDGVNGFVPHPTKNFLYVSNGSGVGANNIAGFTIDPSTGALTAMPNSPYPAGTRPVSLTIDGLGKFLYVVHSDSADIYTYSIDQTTGALTEVGAANRMSVGAGNAGFLALHPNGRFAFAPNSLNGVLYVFAVNPETGILTAVPGSPFATGLNAAGFSIQRNGRIIYVRATGVVNSGTGFIYAFSMNLSTGALTPVSGSPFAAGLTTISQWHESAGRFYYAVNRGMTTLTGTASIGSISAYTINGTTGVLTPAPGSPYTLQPAPNGINVDPTGRFAYVPSAEGNILYSFNIDQTTGALTPLATGATTIARERPVGITAISESQMIAPVEFVSKFAFVPNSTDNTLSSYTINSATGAIAAGNTVSSYAPTPRGLAVHQNGDRLYASMTGASPFFTIASHTINTTTGFLTSATSWLFAADSLDKLRIGPNSAFVYATSPNPVNATSSFVRAYGIVPATGLLTSVSGFNGINTGVNSVDLAIAPNGRYIYPITDSAWAIDTLNPLTGGFNGTGVNNHGATGKTAIAIEPSGRFAYTAIVGMPGGVEVWTINPTFGHFSLQQTVAAGSMPKALAADATGRFIYVVNNGDNDVSTFSINQTNGQLTEVMPRIAAGMNPVAIRADYSGKYVYVVSEGTKAILAYSINQGTGALTAIGSSAATGNGPADIALSEEVR